MWWKHSGKVHYSTGTVQYNLEKVTLIRVAFILPVLPLLGRCGIRWKVSTLFSLNEKKIKWRAYSFIGYSFHSEKCWIFCSSHHAFEFALFLHTQEGLHILSWLWFIAALLYYCSFDSALYLRMMLAVLSFSLYHTQMVILCKPIFILYTFVLGTLTKVVPRKWFSVFVPFTTSDSENRIIALYCTIQNYNTAQCKMY